MVLAVFGLWAVMSASGRYNRMVELEEQINARWSQVKNQYQRRADLIPNVVSTVKGYADFEQKTLQDIVDARSRVGQVQIGDDVTGDPEKLAEYERAQAALGSSLSRLLVVAENYPDLKSNKLFQDLITELEGTENRISVERKRFIEAINQYNTYLRKFPNNLFAGVYGFQRMNYYEGDAGNEQAPKVSF